jgi:uncharacterized coiled-coil protein SlyX
MRISAQQRNHNVARIRAVMDRLLRGDIPAGGKCDIKTLARESGTARAAFYGTRPYAHLREEFEQRLQARRRSGDTPDPREAQVTRLKARIDTLEQRLARRDEHLAELTAFKTAALSQIAAQHDEITRLRRAASNPEATNLRRLPARGPDTGPRT